MNDTIHPCCLGFVSEQLLPVLFSGHQVPEGSPCRNTACLVRPPLS